MHEAAALLLAEFEREYERIVTKAERHVQVWRGRSLFIHLHPDTYTANQPNPTRQQQRAQEHRCEHCQQGATCSLCGEKCIRLEPPVLMCQGTSVYR